jgi:hypothetical protein
METFKDFNFLTISYDNGSQSVNMKWKSFAHGDDFRNGLNSGLDLIKQKGSKKWLADLRDLGTVPTKDQEWSNTDWFPRAVSGGIRKMAIVMPKSTLSAMSVKNIMTKVEGINIETNYFDSDDEARKWLAAS